MKAIYYESNLPRGTLIGTHILHFVLDLNGGMHATGSGWIRLYEFMIARLITVLQALPMEDQVISDAIDNEVRNG
jgi:hypothetical protein